MRKFMATLMILFVLFVIYYDLSTGVLTKQTSIVLLQNNESLETTDTILEEPEQSETIDAKKFEDDLYFKEIEVSAGQTVLSIVEQIHNGPLPVSIPKLVDDFQLLNPTIKPEMIQIGKVYKFPVYKEKN